MPNSFELLIGADAFVNVFRDALANCRRSLYVQFSTFEGDASGQEFADLLIAKADQGVDVRLTIDYYSEVVLSDVYPIFVHRRAEVARERQRTHDLLDRMRGHGIRIRRTAPPGFWGKYMLYRDHKKMVVLDDHTAFIGGINVSDHNYAWHDFMVQIKGTPVHDLRLDYTSSWDGQTTPLDRIEPGGDCVVNQCAGRYPIFEGILDMVRQAQASIVIESPYLLGDHITPALYDAAQRGVKVTLIIPFRSNKLVYRIWVRWLRRCLAHPNVTIYGYQGEHNMTHAKLVLVDGQRASFGSLNMLELEGLTQKELNIFTSNPDFIRQVEALVTEDIADSVVLPPPRSAFGYFSYRILYGFFKWWTQRLVKDADWRAVYC